MKIIYSINLILCFSLVCQAQNNWQKKSDSLAMISRTKADAVLQYFDTIQAPKLLYSMEDRYFYLIIKGAPCYKEYYVALDSLGNIERMHLIKTEAKTKKQRKQQEQYRKLLSEAEPVFDLSRYHTDFITRMPDAKYIRGVPSYFVVKDVDGKRYGEYCLSSLTLPLPIDAKLAGYLIRRLSDEAARDNKAI
jgi:hypothetical protein